MDYSEFVGYFDRQSSKEKVFYLERNKSQFTVEVKSCNRDDLKQIFDSKNFVFERFSEGSIFPAFWVS